MVKLLNDYHIYFFLMILLPNNVLSISLIHLDFVMSNDKNIQTNILGKNNSQVLVDLILILCSRNICTIKGKARRVA